MKYSIVIPCFNEESHIIRLLNSLELQDFSKDSFEVIVVDNASTDRTLEVLYSYQRKTKMKLSVTQETQKGVSKARNLGASMAKGIYILFLDADNTVNEKFLSETSRFISSQAPFGGATFRTLPDTTDFGALFVFYSLEFIKVCFSRPFGKSIVARDLYDRSGGFNDKIVLGENVEFLIRIKSLCFSLGCNFKHIRSPVYCSIRRFQKVGYIKVLPCWLLAYLGFWGLDYKTVDNLAPHNSKKFN